MQVWLVSDQKEVAITDLWGEDDRAFLVFARSMGAWQSAQAWSALGHVYSVPIIYA